MIKSNQICVVLLVTVCFVTNSVLSAAISSPRTSTDDVGTKVGEQTKSDALSSQQQRDAVAPIDPVLCKVPVDASRNVNEEERVVDFQRSLREGRAPIVALISMSNGSGKNTAVPVIVLRDDNNTNNQNPFQALLQLFQGAQQGNADSSSSGGLFGLSLPQLPNFSTLFPSNAPIVNPTNDEQQPTDFVTQMQNTYNTLGQSMSTAFNDWTASVQAAMQSATQSFNSVVLNSVNTVQSNNQNILATLFNNTSTSTTPEPSSTPAASEKPEVSEQADEPSSNDIIAEKVGEEQTSTVKTTTTVAESTTENVTTKKTTQVTTTVKPEEATVSSTVGEKQTSSTTVSSTTTTAKQDSE